MIRKVTHLAPRSGAIMRDKPGHTSARGHLRAVSTETTSPRAELVADLEPWPSAVAGSQLLDEITEALKTHVVAPLPCL